MEGLLTVGWAWLASNLHSRSGVDTELARQTRNRFRVGASFIPMPATDFKGLRALAPPPTDVFGKVVDEGADVGCLA